MNMHADAGTLRYRLRAPWEALAMLRVMPHRWVGAKSLHDCLRIKYMHIAISDFALLLAPTLATRVILEAIIKGDHAL